MKTSFEDMKTRLLWIAAVVVVVLGTAPGVLAQNRQADRVTGHPGYVDFENLTGWFSEEPKIWVNVRGSLLRMVVGATRNEDPELANLLSRLQAVQVRGYSLQTGRPGVDRRIADFARQLESRGWETVVRVREADQRVDMFLQTRNDAIQGVMVMVVEPGSNEAIFVNIVGDVDPDQIGRIGRQFNVRQLESVPAAPRTPRRPR